MVPPFYLYICTRNHGLLDQPAIASKWVEALNRARDRQDLEEMRIPSCNRVLARSLSNTIFHTEMNENESEKFFTHEGNNSGLLGKSFPISKGWRFPNTFG
jgi:hypothetical protein